LLRLNDHDGLVLQKVVDKDIVNSEVFKTAFDNAFFEVTVEAKNLNIVRSIKKSAVMKDTYLLV
jgi:hypothetical protein